MAIIVANDNIIHCGYNIQHIKGQKKRCRQMDRYRERVQGRKRMREREREKDRDKR